MTTLRRFLTFQAFLFWQGGFLFYSAVVVPVGTDLLGSAAEQGLVTQRVTHWLNLGGAVWAVLYGWDCFATPKAWLRRAGWLVCVIGLGLLVWLHAEMDARLDEGFSRKTFRPWHVAYLWVSTVQWAVCLPLVWLTIRDWSNAPKAHG